MKAKEEQGFVVIESTYCILISIFVCMFLISFGFYLYQHTMVSIVANEVAENVAQTYKLRNVTDMSDVSEEDVTEIGKYRYLFFKNRFHSKSKQKAYSYANARLTKTSLANEEGGLIVNVERIVDDIGRAHYEVTVTQRYSFLLEDMFDFIGESGFQTITRTSYSESIDVLNYVNTVKMTQYGFNEIKQHSLLGQTADSVIKLVRAVISLVKTVFG